MVDARGADGSPGDASPAAEEPATEGLRLDPRRPASSNRRLLWPALVGATFLLLTYLIAGQLVGAPLGRKDDHELPVIAAQLRTDGFGPTVASWVDERRGRFRPGYWVLRVTETAIWGLDTRGWYLDRAALLLASLWAGYLLARLWFNPAVSLLAAALLVAGPQAESFGRLGPQEAYAVPLALAGFALIGRKHAVPGLLLLVLSAFIKEPFIPLAFLGLGWAWTLGRRRPAIVAGVALAIPLAGALTQVLGGAHLAGQVRSPTTLARTGLALGWALAKVTGWPLAIFADNRRWLTLISAAIVLPQVFILADLNVSQRYLYPAVFAAILCAAAAASRYRVAYVLVAAILVVQVGRQTLASHHRLVAAEHFSAFIATLGAEDLPIVIHTKGTAVTEQAIAIRRYLPSARISLYPARPADQFDAYVPGPCVEADVQVETAGLCATALQVP